MKSLLLVSLLSLFALSVSSAAAAIQTISFEQVALKRTDAPPFEIGASSDSGLPLHYEVKVGPVSVALDGTVTLEGSTGAVTIRIAQEGNASFEPAEAYFTFLVDDTIWASVASGNLHTVAVRTDGTLWAWGFNSNGQLGDGTTTQRPSPVQVGSEANWASVACGDIHTVAVRTDGTLWAWGSNGNGRLGDGTTTNRNMPVQVGSGTNWASVAGGAAHTVAVRTDGSLWAWGLNGSGRLGDGTTTQRTSPVRIGSDTDWASVACGASYTVAVRTDGTLWAWGFNGSGQLGDGTTTQRTSPVRIGSATDWASVACGSSHTVAVRSNGTLWAWGFNGNGQLGDGTTTRRESPVQVGIATDWASVACGSSHTMAMRADGTLWAWGSNTQGQLGVGTTTNQNSPVQVEGTMDWASVAGGNAHTVAVRNDGTIGAWGRNFNGQLGDGTTTQRPSPVRIGNATDWASAAGGNLHTAGVRNDGTLWAWGSNGSGRLGDGTTTNRNSPVQVGSDTNWVSVVGGDIHTVALRTDGTLWAWGGRLGDGTNTQSPSPVQVGSDTDWMSIAGGHSHTVAVRGDGTLWAWGRNHVGQLGDGTTTERLSPEQVGSSTNWASVACGYFHTVALRADGTLWTWGNNFNGQLGNGTTTQSTTPLQVGSDTDWASVAAGASHTVALRTDGTLWAWGSNANGRLGNGTTTQSTTPVQIGSDTDWAWVACGEEHTVAVRTNGTLWAWGRNHTDQLGDGSATDRTSPVQVGSATNWASVAGGSTHSVAVRTDGTLWTWGWNGSGQLGDGTDTTVPGRTLPSRTAQSIDFSSPGILAVGTPVTLEAVAGSGLPVSYVVAGPAILEGNMLTRTAPGTVHISTFQQGDPIWAPAESVQIEFGVHDGISPDSVTAFWLGGDGSWQTGSSWSSDPLFPNNSASQTFDVVIDASAPAYQVDLGTSVTVNSALINFDGAELRHFDGEFRPGNLIVANGTYRLQGVATLANSTLSVGPGGRFSVDSSTNTRFSNVTLASDLLMDENFGRFAVDGGFDLGGNTLTLFSRATQIYVDENLTLADGTIFSDPAVGNTTRSIFLRNTNTTLTLGSMATLRGGLLEVRRSGTGNRFLVNEGLISADQNGETLRLWNDIPVTNSGILEGRAGGVLRIDNLVSNTASIVALLGGRVELGGNWNNTGTITSDNGTLNLGGNWNNTGTITMDDGVLNLSGSWTNADGTINLQDTSLNLGGSWKLADLGTINRSGGTTTLPSGGILDLEGAAYEVEGNLAPWIMNGGIIRNGILRVTNPENLQFSTNSLNRLYDIELGSNLAITGNTGTLSVNSGFSLGGNTLTLSSSGARIFVEENLALATGTIFSDPMAGGSARVIFLRFDGTTLTLESGAALRGGLLEIRRSGTGSQFLSNEGLISADQNGQTITLWNNIPVTNTGTLEARDGGILRIENFSANSGILSVLSGSIIEVQGDLSAGSGTQVEIGATGAPVPLQITGTATLGGSLTVEIAEDYTPVLGDRFIILQANVISGSFDTIYLPESNGQPIFDMTVGATEIELTVTAAQSELVTALWLGGDGSWLTSSLWSSDPLIPDNSVLRGFNVVIDAVASPYRVDLSAPVTVNSVLLNFEGAELRHFGGDFRPGSLNVASGTYRLEGGARLADSTLAFGAEGIFSIDSSTNNRFSNVTLASDLKMVDNGGRIVVDGNFSLDGNTLSLFGTGTGLYVDDDLVLANGRIFSDVSASGSRFIFLRYNNGTFTLGSDVIVQGGRLLFQSTGATGNRYLVNEGLISADRSGQPINLWKEISVTNTGIMEARNGGSLSIDNLVANTGSIIAMQFSSVSIGGNWTNTGTISVESGGLNLRGSGSNAGGTINLQNATFNILGSLSPSKLGTIHRTGGNFAIGSTGILDLEGEIYTIDEELGPWFMSGGTIQNGRLNLSDPAKLRFSSNPNNRLYGIALQSDLRIVDNNGSLAVNGSFSLNGNVLTLAGNGSMIFVDRILTLADGDIFSDPTSGSSLRRITLRNPAPALTTLTLGSGAAVRGGRLEILRGESGISPLFNAGLISADQSGETIHLRSSIALTNTGVLEASDGGILRIDNLATNSGTLSVRAGSVIDVRDDFSAGSVTHLEVGATGAPVPVQITGMATLGGILSVEMAGSYSPTQGDVFVILQATGINGSFDTVHLPEADGQPIFELTVGATQIVLTVAGEALPVVSDPIPGDGAVSTAVHPQLSWTASIPSESYLIYFGTNETLEAGDQIGATNATEFSTPLLRWDTQYFWRVDAVNQFGTIPGPVWSFTTRIAPEPTWVAGNGNWSDGANWSLAPYFPQNGLPASSDGYSVRIGASGSYTIVIDQDITIDQLVVDAPGARVLHTSGTLSVLGSFEILNGVYEQAGGRLSDATVNVGEGGSWHLTANSILRNVTLDSGTELIIPNNRTLSIEGDLALNVATLRLASTGSITRLRFVGGNAQTLGGMGEILFAGNSNDGNNRIEAWTNNTHLFIDEDITIRSVTSGGQVGLSQTVTLRGSILSEADGRTISINPGSFHNEGFLFVGGTSTLAVNNFISDTGLTALDPGARLNISGSYGPTGRILFGIAGNSAQQIGRVSVSGQLAPGGILEAEFAGGYLPSSNGRYDLITAASITSEFDSVLLPELADGSFPEIFYDVNLVALVVAGSPPDAPSSPFPANGLDLRPIDLTLAWIDTGLATSFDVYFGTNPAPGASELQGTQVARSFDPGILAHATTYYWRVDARNQRGTTTGPLWSFTTRPAPASISGIVWNDEDGDGLVGPGEPRLQGWSVYLDFNDNGVRNGGEPLALSAANGSFAFNNLLPGEYVVRQVMQNTWAQSTPPAGAAHRITLEAGQDITDLNFGNRRTAPTVTNVALSRAQPVPASNDLRITVRFDRTMNTSVEPSLTLTAQAGQDAPVIPPGGQWLSQQRSNDAYRTPPITIEAGMDGDHTLELLSATDPLGLTTAPATLLTLSVNATPPPAPDPVVETITANSITISWAGYAAPADLNLFRIYREDTPFTSLEGLSALDGRSASSRSYTFSGLQPDRTYHVAVAAVDSALNMARDLASLPIEITSTLPPPVVLVLTRPALGTAALDWSAYDTSGLLGFAGFRVYLSETPFASVDGLTPKAEFGPSVRNAIVDNLDRTKEYHLAVVPFNGLGAYVPEVTTVLWRDLLADTITQDIIIGGPGETIEVPVPLVVDAGATLTIPAGTTLVFAAGSGIAVVNGRLLALGTADAPVQLTAANEDDRARWNGVLLSANAGGSQLRHTWIRHGAGLHLEGATNPTLDALRLVWNDPAGLTLSGGATASTTGAFLALNTNGVLVDETSALTIQDSVIKNNLTNATVASGGTLAAPNNWWGLDDRADVPATIEGTAAIDPVSGDEPILAPVARVANAATQTGTRAIHLRLHSPNAISYRASEDSTFTGAFFEEIEPDAASADLYRSAPSTVPFQLSDGGGLKTLYLQFRSASGEVSETITFDVEYITAGPAITALSVEEGDEFTRPVEITAGAIAPLGITSLRLLANGVEILSSPNGELSGLWDFRGQPSGIVRLRLEARDAANNLAAREFNVRLSPEPPNPPAIASPANGDLFATPTIAVNGSADPGIEVRLTRNDILLGTTIATVGGTFAFFNVPLLEGANALVARAVDVVGAATSIPVVVNLDTVPPAPLILESASYLVSQGIRLTWRFSPEGKRAARFRVLWHDAPFTSPAEASGQSDLLQVSTFTLSGVPDGTYHFAVIGLDAAGNASPLSNVLPATYDATRPSFTVVYDRPVPVGPGTLGITITASETLVATPGLTVRPANFSGPVNVTLTEVSPNTFTGAYALSTASGSSGPVEVRVTGRDLAGNSYSGPPSGPTLVFEVNAPTGAIFVAAPTPIQVLDGPVSIPLALTTSKAVPVAPALSFTPPEGSPVEILLTGEGTQWQGELALAPSMGTGFGTFVYSAADAIGNSGNTLTAGDELEIYNTAEAPPPLPPTGLQVVSRKAGAIEVFWTAAERAEVYHVYRAVGAIGPAPTERIATIENPFTLVYADTPPADGPYRYAVTSARLGSESGPSATAAAVSDRTPPEAPENLAVELTLSGRVRISWEAPSTGETPAVYLVYRNSTDAPLRALVNAGSTDDSPPRGLIQYWVSSADAVGNENFAGPVAIEMFVGAVADLRGIVTHSQPARLEWTTPDIAATGHNIYRDGVRLNTGGPVTAQSFDLPFANPPAATELAVRAVDAEGREGAARSVRLIPLDLALGINPDPDTGVERPLLRRYFDRYVVRIINTAGESTRINEVAVSRKLPGRDPTTRFRSLDNGENTLASGASGAWAIPFPGPDATVPDSIFTVEARRFEEDGSAALYRRTFAGPASGEAPGMVTVSVDSAPVAGGLTNVTARFHNLGYADMDLLVVRSGGSMPGNLTLEIVDAGGNVANAAVFDRPVSGMSVAGNGRGYLRVPPGESRAVVFEDVLIPAFLGESGFAGLRVSSGDLFHNLGGLSEITSGPITGLMTTNLTETPYFGEITPTAPGFTGAQPITLTGLARDRDTGAPVPDVDLRVGIQVRGYHWFEMVRTGPDGSFNFSYEPPAGLAGSINFWAAHPDVVDILGQAEVALLSLLSNPSRGTVRMSKNDTLDFNIDLVNPGDIPLTPESLTVQAYTVSLDEEGGEILTPIDSVTGTTTVPLPTTLAGNRRERVHLRLQADLDAPDSILVKFIFTTVEGASRTFRADVSLIEPVPILRVSAPTRGYVDRSLDRGDVRSQRVVITNAGLRNLEGVEVTPPKNIPWIQTTLAVDGDGIARLPDLAVGDEFEFQIVFTPGSEVPLGFYDDVLTITGTNAVGDFTLSVFAEITSNLTGSALFAVTNILDQQVPNASIRLRNTTNRLEVGPLYSDSLGEVLVPNLQEGRWSWQITAPGHSAATGTVDIEADQTSLVEAELGRSLVTITFEVVPVPFTDRYIIRLEQTFETRIPLPVLVMTPPNFEFTNINPGFEATVMFELSNEGLASIDDVEVLGARTSVGMLEPLIDFIPELRPGQRVQIPARIRLFEDSSNTVANESLASGGGFMPMASGSPTTLAGCGPDTTEDFVNGIAALLKMTAKGEATKATGNSMALTAFALIFLSVADTVSPLTGRSPAGAPTASFFAGLVGSLIQCASNLSSGEPPGRPSPGTPRPGSPPPYRAEGTGCFPAETPVRLASGEVRSIADLQPGDRLHNGTPQGSELGTLFRLESEDLRRLALRCFNGHRGTRKLEVTGAHRLWVDGKGWTHVRDIRPGDWLAAEGGGHWVVEHHDHVEGLHTVYNFHLKGDRAFYAHGVRAEDLCGGLFVDLTNATEVSE